MVRSSNEPRRISPVTGRRSRSFWRLTMIRSCLILKNETKAGGAIMQIEASGGDAVDFDALTNWMAKSGAAQRMPQVCNNFLAREDIYLVSEAFRISKASYGLVDKNGVKLMVTGGAFGKRGRVLRAR